MADFGISFDDGGLGRDLKRLGGRANPAMRQGMERSLYLVGGRAKELSRERFDTGRMMSSIGAKTSEGIHEVKGLGVDVVGQVGSRVRYTPHQEIGFTSRAGRWIKGALFMQRATKEKAEQVVRIFRDTVDRLLKGVRL